MESVPAKPTFDAPGTRLSSLEYAPIAELVGRLPWALEVFHCQAPDSTNMELLLRFADAAQSAHWLDSGSD